MKEKEMEELAERTASKLFEKIMKYIAIGFILYLVVMVGSFGIHEIKRINEERKAKEYEKWLNEPIYTIENNRKDWYWVFSERYKVSEDIGSSVAYILNGHYYCGTMYASGTNHIRNRELQYILSNKYMYIICFKGDQLGHTIYEYEVYRISSEDFISYLEDPKIDFWEYLKDKKIDHGRNEDGWTPVRRGDV